MNDPNLQARLRAGKSQLRARRTNLSLPEKVAQVVQLQSVVLPLVRRRRNLKPWERVWTLTSHERR
jgi:hypothetical protein